MIRGDILVEIRGEGEGESSEESEDSNDMDSEDMDAILFVAVVRGVVQAVVVQGQNNPTAVPSIQMGTNSLLVLLCCCCCCCFFGVGSIGI